MAIDQQAGLRCVQERCREMKLPTWRMDARGTLLEEPEDPGLAGLWLKSGPIAAAVTRAAAVWDGQDPPEPFELFHGCWLIPLAEKRRRRVVGYLAAMAVSKEALVDAEFRRLCAETNLDTTAVRKALRPMANLESDAVPTMARTLRWMQEDATRAAEQAESIAGFTTQLSDSFETIDLLYSLGRSMNDLARPAEFIDAVCEMLMRTMRFGFVGCVMHDAEGLEPALRGAVKIGGNADPTALLVHTAAAWEANPDSPHGVILAEVPVLADGSPTQMIAHRIVRGGEHVGSLVAGDKQGVDPQVSSYDTQLFDAACGYIGAFLDNAALYAQQRALFLGSIEALAAAIEAKDRYTCGHAKRVSHLSEMLARAVGLSAGDCETIRISGLLHDVGKIGVPEAVLCKTGRLADDEFAAIKLHPEIGHRILKDIPQLAAALPGVMHHHERFDGKGYPHGLSGEAIPLMARIMAVADTFDAMSSTRSYRPALPREKVLAEIERCGGTQFDPGLARAFVTLDFSAYDAMVAEHHAAEGWTQPAPQAQPARLAA